MPTDRSLITVSDLVRRATAIVDPQGEDPAVVELATRFGDDDEPVRGVLDGLEQRLAWGADEDPPVVMAQALVLYLGHRLDELEDDEEDLMRLAARSEFEGRPPEGRPIDPTGKLPAIGIPIQAPSCEDARIWEGRSAIASEYSARNRAGIGAGENMARFSRGIVSLPSSGETVWRRTSPRTGIAPGATSSTSGRRVQK